MDAPDARAQHYSEQHLELENASVHPTHRGRFGWLECGNRAFIQVRCVPMKSDCRSLLFLLVQPLSTWVEV